MVEPVVAVEHVFKCYAGHVAVRDLSLRVRPGIVFGLLGPNGAGKTTTIRMINDIVRPDEGSILLFGALSPGPAALRRIGYLPEERGLYPKMTVRNVLRLVGELRGLRARDLTPRIERWLGRLELSAWMDRKVETLSKGMQQKVQFVAAVLHEPDLLILDEPFSGLDPLNADVLRDIVREQKQLGRTIVFSTHLMEHAEQLCDELCIIAHAEKVLEGELASIKREAREQRRAYRVEADPSGRLPGVLRGVAGIESVEARESGCVIVLDAGCAPRDILGRLLEQGVDVVDFQRIEPTLHEIFVERVRDRGAGPLAAANRAEPALA